MLTAFRQWNEPRDRREAWRLVFVYTAISVAVSATATYVFARANGWNVGDALIPAVSIPFLVAPWMTWTIANYAIKLHAMRNEFERLAITDPLSGALNRRGLRDFGDRAFSARMRKPLSTIVLDIDRFKSINDSFGHSAGDAVIARAVEVLRQITGSEDCAIGRPGGDELAALIVGRSLEETMILAERLRDALEHAIFFHDDKRLKVTASIGVSVANLDDANVEAMLKRADQSLYAAKSAGRNRVRAAA